MPAIGLAVLAALLFGAGTALQAHVAGVHDVASGPGETAVRPTGLRSLAGLLTRPLWLVGTVLDWLGALTHVAALHFGPLTLVQPLSLTAIVFAVLTEAVVARRRPRARQLVAAGQTALGLVVLAVCLGPQSDGSHVDPRTSCTGVAALGLAIGAAALLSRVCSSPRGQALVLGASAGAAYGLSDALARTVQVPAVTGFRAPAEILAAVTGLVVGGAGLLLTQAALQRRGLASSMPAQDLFALLVSIGMGALLLREVPHLGGTALVAVAVAMGVTGHGILRLGRTQRVDSSTSPGPPGDQQCLVGASWQRAAAVRGPTLRRVVR